MNNTEAMRAALDLARQADSRGEVPVGAVILKNGSIIGRGLNQREGLQNPLRHAEVTAIEDACEKVGTWRLKDC